MGFRFKPIVDNDWSFGDPFLWAHPVTLYSSAEHTFKFPLCLVHSRMGGFDLLVKLMQTGYHYVNEQST